MRPTAARSIKPLWGIFADLHFQQPHLDRIVSTATWLTSTFRAHKVSQIICLGDVLNTRETVSVQALSKAADMFRELRKVAPVHVVLGNHDMNLKFSGRISSLDFLEGVGGVRVYREMERVEMDGRRAFMVPWYEEHGVVVEELEKMAEGEKRETVFFGHAAVNGAVMNTRAGMRHTGPLTPAHLKAFQAGFLGHFHHHQRLGTSNAWYTGATMQHHYGDANDRGRGIILYDPSNPQSPGAVRHDYVQNPDWDIFRSAPLESLERQISEGLGTEHVLDYRGKRVQVVCPAGSMERYDAVRKGLIKTGAESVVRRIVLTSPLPPNSEEIEGESDGTLVEQEQKSATKDFSREGMVNLLPKFLTAVQEVGAFPRDESLEEYTARGLALVQSSPNITELAKSGSQKDFSATLRSLTIMNFLSVQGTMNLPFNEMSPGIRYIIGPNGSGKSLMLEAIVWCLFGRLIRPNATAEGVVNSTIGKNCMVEVCFENGYTIQRLRKFTSKGAKSIAVKVFKDGVELPEFERGEHSASQAALERDILGCEFGIFTKCVMLGDIGRGAANFLSMEKAERRSLLEEVLGFGAFDEVLEEARGKRKEWEGKLEEALNTDQNIRRKLELDGHELDRLELQTSTLEHEVETIGREWDSVGVRQKEFFSEKDSKLRHQEESKFWHDKFEEVQRLQNNISHTKNNIEKHQKLEELYGSARGWIILEDERVSTERDYITLETKLNEATKEILSLSSNIAAYYETLHAPSSVSEKLTAWLQRLFHPIARLFGHRPSSETPEPNTHSLSHIKALTDRREEVAKDMHRTLVAKEAAAARIAELQAAQKKASVEGQITSVGKFTEIVVELGSRRGAYLWREEWERDERRLREVLDGKSIESIAEKAGEYERYRHYDPQWEKRILAEFEHTIKSLDERQEAVEAKLASISKLITQIKDEEVRLMSALEKHQEAISGISTELKFVRFWEMAFEKNAKKDVPNVREWLVGNAVEELNVLVGEKLDLVMGETGESDSGESDTLFEEPKPRRTRRKKSDPTTDTEDPPPRKKRSSPKLRPENFVEELKFTSSLTLPPSIGLLSSGQLKRCSISILLSLFQLCRRNSHFRPDFLFLDEAFDTLDESGRKHAILLLEEIVRVEGIRVAGVVSHNLTEEMLEGGGTLRVEMGRRGTRIVDSEGVVGHDVERIA